jgi:hypothetical protein
MNGSVNFTSYATSTLARSTHKHCLIRQASGQMTELNPRSQTRIAKPEVAITLDLETPGLDCQDSMNQKRTVLALAAVLMASALAIAACSSSPASDTSTTTSSPVQTTGPTSSTTQRSSTTSHAVNVPVTNQIRQQLVAAGAALNSLPASEYTGLAPGLTYYAFDQATATYWAGARLVPAPSADPSSPTQAQISSQDAGSYYLFKLPQRGSWTAYAAGNVGPDASCPLTVPDDVLAVWGWPKGACRPANN